jgi:hypothetical protein
LGIAPTTQLNFRIQSYDFRTLWIARQLELTLNWKPHTDASVDSVPAWLRWPAAQGNEPLLDCRTDVSFVANDIQ